MRSVFGPTIAKMLRSSVLILVALSLVGAFIAPSVALASYQTEEDIQRLIKEGFDVDELDLLIDFDDATKARIEKQINKQFDTMQRQLSDSLLKFRTYPETPGPYQTVRIVAEAPGVNVNKEFIHWYVNGKLVASGRAEKEIEIKTGAIGEKTRVEAVMEADIVKFPLTKELIIIPAEISVLWEADTYTPPFYKGKALPAFKSTIRFVPLPNVVNTRGRVIPADELVYTWKKDYKVLPAVSGYGKNDVEVEVGYMSVKDKFSVLVEDPDSDAKAENTLDIRIAKPMITFYEKDPLYGIDYAHALSSNINLRQDEVTIHAVPYFFSKDDLDTPVVTHSWTINNQFVAPAENSPYDIILRKPKGITGLSRVRTEIRNLDKILQQANSTLNVRFEE